jgi:hypothetical protein
MLHARSRDEQGPANLPLVEVVPRHMFSQTVFTTLNGALKPVHVRCGLAYLRFVCTDLLIQKSVSHLFAERVMEMVIILKTRPTSF